MEIRARYVQMGAFTLAVIAAGFAFVYWLNNAGGWNNRTIYHVRFDNPVSGLLSGSAVLFNGIRVGEVTSLKLSSADARQVQATIAIDQSTPVRADTKVGIDFQGLMGSPAISLVGGTSTSPPTSVKGEPPVLIAEPAAGQSMSQAAREVLRRMDGVLADNSQPLQEVITNINRFADALGRNSGRVDAIMAGLERMTGGAAAKARLAVYDLTVPRSLPAPEKAVAFQLVIPEPTALNVLDNEKILTKAAGGASVALPDAQWSDMLPKLLQVKIIQTFENANQAAEVSRPVEGVAKDFQLLIDIRSFQISISQARTAEVEFVGKILDSNGRIIGTRNFQATEPAEATDAAGAAAALDKAFGKAAAELVAWASRAIGDIAQAAGAPRGVSRNKATKG